MINIDDILVVIEVLEIERAAREEMRIYGLCPREALKFVIYGPMIHVQSSCEDSLPEDNSNIL